MAASPIWRARKIGRQIVRDDDALLARRLDGLEHAADHLIVTEADQAFALDLDEQRDIGPGFEQLSARRCSSGMVVPR